MLMQLAFQLFGQGMAADQLVVVAVSTQISGQVVLAPIFTHMHQDVDPAEA